ncbi:TetR/AcrR family transcriptional regulator [Allorhizobium undicola]|uniref:TetR/AcrR family transcriptional regulator n=1 Tax=Allorhizobium undicola TaxID=78527 RepID=UPI003D33FCDA
MTLPKIAANGGSPEKQRRIREASRAMFLSKGFENATIRDIARIAEVAQGTLFLYAATKRELLFMLYNDFLEQVTESCTAVPERQLSVVESLMQITLLHLQRYTDEIAIARLSLVSLNLYDNSREAERFAHIYGRTISLIEALLQRAIEKGELSQAFALRPIAGMIFTLLIELFKSYVRSDPPDIAESLREIHSQLSVIMRGLSATERAYLIQDPRLAEWLG